MRVEYFRMPDGAVTSNVQEYGLAWKKLGEVVQAYFPGYCVTGYDPDICLATSDYKHSMVLSVHAIEALKKGVDCEIHCRA